MESLLEIGLYTCFYCGEHSKGNRIAIQEFVAEHMCPCRNDNEQIINLKECIDVLSENASSVLAVAAKTSAPPAKEVGNKGKIIPEVILNVPLVNKLAHFNYYYRSNSITTTTTTASTTCCANWTRDCHSIVQRPR